MTRLVNYRHPLLYLEFRLQPAKLIFFSIFFLVYCFSGMLSALTGFQYRMGLVSFIAIPLLLLRGVRIARVEVMYIILTTVIFASFLVNNTSFFDFATFVRIPVFSFLVYYTSSQYITRLNIDKILRYCLSIGMLQMPVMILQFLSYEYLPIYIRSRAAHHDIGFGTFNWGTDNSMTLFLGLLVAFILFDRNRNYIVKRKWIVVSWLTLSILISNAQLGKIFIILIWALYVFRFFSFRTLLSVIFAGIFLTILVSVYGATNLSDENVTTFVDRLNISSAQESVEQYLEGKKYARSGALYYFLTNPIQWLGDGPSKYSNPYSWTLIRSNTGHLFKFYSEVGLLGLLFSYLVFFLMIFPGDLRHMRVSWLQVIMCISVVLYSLVSETMNDIGIVLTYSIFSLVYLLPPSAYTKLSDQSLPNSNYLKGIRYIAH